MMLQISGEQYHLIPIREFRIRNLLSPEFGVKAFLPKDYTGLGEIDEAKIELQHIHASVVAAVPESPPPSWMGMTLELQAVFQAQLDAYNCKIGLKRSEIEYAVLGFGEVVQLFVNGLINAWMWRQPIPTFEDVYSNWLNQSTRLSNRVFSYSHRGENWNARLVKNAYGVIGLAVDTGENIYYVRDAERQCPAEGFMFNLLKDVLAKINGIANKAALEIVHGS